MKTEKKYSEKELVLFANYLLSEARKETIHKGHSQFLCYDSDLENWKEECRNANKRHIELSENGIPLRHC